MIKTINFDEIPHAYWIKDILHPNPPSLERRLEKIVRNEFGIKLNINTSSIIFSDYIERENKQFHDELEKLFGTYNSIDHLISVFNESNYKKNIREMNRSIFENNMSGTQIGLIICSYGFFLKGVSYPPRGGGPYWSSDEDKQANIEFIIS